MINYTQEYGGIKNSLSQNNIKKLLLGAAFFYANYSIQVHNDKLY